MTSYKVVTTEPFNDQFKEREEWWFNNREKNPLALCNEFDAALLIFEDSPWAGQQVPNRPKEFRSILLQKTQYRIAYRIDGDVVTVLAIWGASERSPPSF